MPTGRKLAVVLSVLVAGWSAALVFRKDASTSVSKENESTPALLSESNTNEPLTRRAISRPDESSSPFRAPIAAAQVAPEIEETPQFPVQFPSDTRRTPAAMSPFAGEESELAQADEAIERDRAIEDNWPAEVHERTHRIVDGDTLRRLAQRYLGSADRFGEIYEANRDMLRNPDLLPIGKVLRLPERANSAKGRMGQPMGDDRQARHEEQAMPPMIPIPRGPLRVPTE